MADAIEEPNPQLEPKTWEDKFKRLMVLTGLAHEGAMLAKMQRQNRIVEDIAKRTANGTIGKESGGDDMPEDDTVSIGNEYHYHYQGDAKSQEGAQTPASAAVKNGLGTLGKVALGAALLGTGGAGMLAAQKIIGPSVAAGVDTDTDSTTDVNFPK